MLFNVITKNTLAFINAIGIQRENYSSRVLTPVIIDLLGGRDERRHAFATPIVIDQSMSNDSINLFTRLMKRN